MITMTYDYAKIHSGSSTRQIKCIKLPVQHKYFTKGKNANILSNRVLLFKKKSKKQHCPLPTILRSA